MEKVREAVGKFGIMINDVVIDEPQADESVQKSFDNVRESELALQAAKFDADAEYIKIKRSAEADKERDLLRGDGVAGFRARVMSNYPAILLQLIKEGMNPSKAQEVMMQAMYLDTIREASEHGNMIIVTNGKMEDGNDIAKFLQDYQVAEKVETKQLEKKSNSKKTGKKDK